MAGDREQALHEGALLRATFDQLLRLEGLWLDTAQSGDIDPPQVTYARRRADIYADAAQAIREDHFWAFAPNRWQRKQWEST